MFITFHTSGMDWTREHITQRPLNLSGFTVCPLKDAVDVFCSIYQCSGGAVRALPRYSESYDKWTWSSRTILQPYIMNYITLWSTVQSVGGHDVPAAEKKFEWSELIKRRETNLQRSTWSEPSHDCRNTCLPFSLFVRAYVLWSTPPKCLK